MRTGELQARLTATNLWWRRPQDWAAQDPDLQEASAAPFTHSAGVLGDLARGGLYVLRGPRRVGKSVELKRTIEQLIEEGADPRAIMHMSVDGWSADDLGALLRAAERLMPPDGHRWWLIDEITAISDGWPAQIKWMRDNSRRFRQDTVVLTGSSSSDLRDSVGDLAGRRGPADDPDRVMLPIGFRTFVRLTERESDPQDATGLPLSRWATSPPTACATRPTASRPGSMRWWTPGRTTCASAASPRR
ncbi:MAG: AAA family ATPase [Acidimicrobiaceae bacterium]|nr:AAA family ATPase [Acidimicrobiaceae bacterium]